MNLGNLALLLALTSGSAALAAYWLWARGRTGLQRIARVSTAGLALGVLLASALHLINLLTHQFQYEYVTNFSDRSLPFLLLVASFWGGQAGSFLLWSAWSVIFALVLIGGLWRSTWEPYVLTPYLLVTVCITGITLASGPFTMLPETPVDGNGLNPLLQNYWMAIHPPILFTGFTTMAGPFAFAIAALWQRDYQGWVRLARPWTLLAWACLGTGLALGGFWAYESLGWGGFWGWDPVENSSLVPWLFASALLHGLVLQGARGNFTRSNLFLSIIGYLMVIYSTFLTRSGILGKVSVHSFVELGLMGYLVAFLAMFAVLGGGMLLWRWRSIGWRVLYHDVRSREFSLLISVVLFVVMALIVGIGTSMPVISLLPVFERPLSVDMAWYGPTVAPFGLLVLVTMAIGPLLGWQRAKYGSLWRLLKWPTILSGVVVVACVLVNIIYPVALLFIGAAVFAASANAVAIMRIWRAGPLHLGGYLSHVGIGLLFLGVVGTSLYKQTASLRLTQDTPQLVFGRQVTFRGLAVSPDDPLERRAMEIEVTEPPTGQTWVAYAPYYVFAKTGQLVMHPAIESGVWSDLYIAPSQYTPAAQTEPGVLQLVRGQAVSAFGYTFTFDRFQLPDRDAMLRGDGPVVVQAITTVQAPDGRSATITPTLSVETGNPPVSTPVTVPGGVTLTLRNLDPANQLVQVQLGGVDLRQVTPEDMKAQVFVDVSVEPGIKLVWSGFILGVLGGLLALIRRWQEAQPRVRMRPVLRPRPTPHQPVPPSSAPAVRVSHGEVHR